MAKRKKTRWESDYDFNRRVGRKKQRFRRFLTPTIGRGPLLRQQKVKFRYETEAGINPGVLGTAVHIFSANGVFDPDITGVGHQPRGFDELMALYDHAVVIGAKITVDWVASASETRATRVGIALRDSNTTDDGNGYIEGGNVVYDVLAIENFYKCRQTLQCNPNKFLGRSKPLADRDLKNSTSSNPAEQAFFHVFRRPVFSADDPGTACACVVLEYEVVLIEPKVPTQS